MAAKVKAAPKTAKFVEILGRTHVANKAFFLYENKGKGFVALENNGKTLWSDEFADLDEARAWIDSFAIICGEDCAHHKFRTVKYAIESVLS